MKLLLFPALCVALATPAAFALAGPAAAVAAGFGGLAALAGAGLTGWRLRRSGGSDAYGQLRLAYRTSIERFLVVCVLLAAGLGLLKLPPLYLVGGFVAGQLAVMVSSVLAWRSVS